MSLTVVYLYNLSASVNVHLNEIGLARSSFRFKGRTRGESFLQSSTHLFIKKYLNSRYNDAYKYKLHGIMDTLKNTIRCRNQFGEFAQVSNFSRESENPKFNEIYEGFKTLSGYENSKLPRKNQIFQFTGRAKNGIFDFGDSISNDI